jgi:DMSO/TMAO reductase YedYZ molybdopterin-dependent catalytic subunit
VAERALVGRRAFLATALATGASLAIGCDPRKPREKWLGAMERWNARVQRGLFSSSRTAPTARAGDRTASGDFPEYFVSDALPLAPAGWALEVRGLVDRPAVFTLDDLQRMTRTDLRVEHHCVEGWSAVADWHGVQMREIARIVGAHADAPFVEFRSFDAGYWSSWDRESVDHPQTLLAYGMNGAPLTPGHGAPLRLYGAVKLGYKSVKYLTQIAFLPAASGGYWEDLGYEWYAGV